MCSGFTVFIPSYGSMVGILSLLCLFVRLRISQQQKKDSSVKLRVLVLSGMSFSHFIELWPRGGPPRSLHMRRGGRFLGLRRAKIANKSRIAEKLARSTIYQIRDILAVWWDMRLADALVLS